MTRQHVLILSGLVIAGLALTTDTTVGQDEPAATQPDDHAALMLSITEAVCVITPTEGSFVNGVIRYVQDGDEMHITADLTGLEPGSEHAWHIHEFGDITDPKGLATGGHYNPTHHPHGLPHNPDRHAGDFGNLTADDDGNAHAELTVDNITIAGVYNPIIGRGMIIHAQLDDGGQPTGNAGARIGQGVIGIAQPGE